MRLDIGDLKRIIDSALICNKKDAILYEALLRKTIAISYSHPPKNRKFNS